jgi:hypothetical protein
MLKAAKVRPWIFISKNHAMIYVQGWKRSGRALFFLRAGQALSACGEKLLGISGKQEPGSAARCSPEAADAAA